MMKTMHSRSILGSWPCKHFPHTLRQYCTCTNPQEDLLFIRVNYQRTSVVFFFYFIRYIIYVCTIYPCVLKPLYSRTNYNKFPFNLPVLLQVFEFLTVYCSKCILYQQDNYCCVRRPEKYVKHKKICYITQWNLMEMYNLIDQIFIKLNSHLTFTFL